GHLYFAVFFSDRRIWENDLFPSFRPPKLQSLRYQLSIYGSHSIVSPNPFAAVPSSPKPDFELLLEKDLFRNGNHHSHGFPVRKIHQEVLEAWRRYLGNAASLKQDCSPDRQ